MTAPLGFTHRHDPGLVGVLARWWGAYRVRRVRAARDARRITGRRS